MIFQKGVGNKVSYEILKYVRQDTNIVQEVFVMKKVNLYLFIFAGLLFGAMAIGCGNPNALYATWDSNDEPDYWMTLNRDGTLQMGWGDALVLNGTFSTSGNSITMEVMGETGTGTFYLSNNNNTLTTHMEGDTDTFTRRR